jgi:phage major head subunit gpT-like protein
MDITQDTLDLLRVDFSKAFQDGYEAAQAYSAPFWTRVSSGTSQNVYGWLAQQLVAREWEGPRVVQNLSEHKHTIDNKSFEGTVEIDRDHIEDDSLGIFSSAVLPQLGAAAGQLEDQFFETIIRLNSGNGATAFDGKTLFADDHPNYAPATDAVSGATVPTTFDNKDALTFNATNLRTVWNKMTNQRGEDGRPMRIKPTHLLHAPQLRFEVATVLTSMTYAQMVTSDPGTGATAQAYGVATVENPMRGLVIPVECPGLADNGTFWALADFSKPIKPFVLQMRRPVQFVTQDRPDSPDVFSRKKFLYGFECRMGYGVSLPHLIYRGNTF